MYREISSRFLGERQRITDIQVDQGRYATVLIRALSGYLKFQPGAHILDIGGSAGRIALEFQNLFHAQATILDPAEEEIAAARKLGLNGVVGSVETWYPDEPFDLVLLCRTVEHVLDLRALLARIRTWLRPDGYLYCDIVDFTAACRLVGHPEAVSKIDHCYWLTQESAPNIFRRAGFDIVSINLSLQQPLLGFLLRPAEPVMFPWASVEPDAIQRQLRTIQEIASVWQEYGRTSLDLHDALRRRAYRVKRALTRWVSS
jgi:SAM-dependent methyltransferase